MKEFVKNEDKIYINTPYAEAYIPVSLFESDEESKSSVAVQYGDGFKVVGIMNMRFFDSDDEPRDSRPLRTFNYPNMIMTYPSDSTVSKIQLLPHMEPERYVILRYYMGDVMMNAEEVKATENCTKFLKMITMGKIPNTIPYDQFISMWHSNFSINDFNPQVPSVVLQMIWAEMCRVPDDLLKPFRLVYGKGHANTTAYVESNMNTVASATSVFSALSFERITEKIATSLNMSRDNVEQRRSPIEQVLSM